MEKNLRFDLRAISNKPQELWWRRRKITSLSRVGKQLALIWMDCLKPFSTNNKRVNVARSDKTDIWPLAGELRKIIVAKSRWRTERTTHWRWRNAKIIHTTKTHWKITHHTGALMTILSLVVLGKLDLDSFAEEVRVIDSVDRTLRITLIDSDKS